MGLFGKSDGVLKRLKAEKKELAQYHSSLKKFQKNVRELVSTRENAAATAETRAMQRLRGIYKRGVLDIMQHAYHVGCLEVQRAKTMEVLDNLCISLLQAKEAETLSMLETIETYIGERKRDKSVEPELSTPTRTFCEPPSDVIGKNYKVVRLRTAVHRLTRELEGSIESLEMIKPLLKPIPWKERIERLKSLVAEEVKHKQGLDVDSLATVLSRLDSGARSLRELLGAERWRASQLRRRNFACLISDQRCKEGRILHRWCDQTLGEGKDDYIFGAAGDFHRIQPVIASSKESSSESMSGRRISTPSKVTQAILASAVGASPLRAPDKLSARRSNADDSKVPPPPVVLDFIAEFTGLVARSVGLPSHWEGPGDLTEAYDAVQRLVAATIYPRLRGAFLKHLEALPQVARRDERWRERCHFVAQLSAREQDIDPKVLGPLRLPTTPSAPSASSISNVFEKALHGAWSQAWKALEIAGVDDAGTPAEDAEEAEDSEGKQSHDRSDGGEEHTNEEYKGEEAKDAISHDPAASGQPESKSEGETVIEERSTSATEGEKGSAGAGTGAGAGTAAAEGEEEVQRQGGQAQSGAPPSTPPSNAATNASATDLDSSSQNNDGVDVTDIHMAEVNARSASDNLEQKTDQTAVQTPGKEPQSTADTEGAEDGDGDPPGLFAASIALLNAIESAEIPEDMVDLLMSAMRCAAEEVECRSPPGKMISLDADTLTPILVYIVCRCGWDTPHATLAFLAHFGVTGMGEDAYYVTSVAQAVGHVCTMKPSKIRRRRSTSTSRQLFSDSEDDVAPPTTPRARLNDVGSEDSRNFIFHILRGGDEEGKSHEYRGSALARSISQRSGLSVASPTAGDVAATANPPIPEAKLEDDTTEYEGESEYDSLEDDEVFDVSVVLQDNARDRAAQKAQKQFLTREMAMERLVAAFY